MKLAVGSDERTELTNRLIDYLRAHGHEVDLHGAIGDGDDDYVRIAEAVADRVARGEADQGILCCWTGTGVSIVANKVPGVRAALCADAETARGARTWNHANVLALSLRLTSPVIAEEILGAWFATPVGDGPNAGYADAIGAVEDRHRPARAPVRVREQDR